MRFRICLLLTAYCLLLPGSARCAQGDTKTIAELDATTAVADGDLVPIWDISQSTASKTRKVAFSDFRFSLLNGITITGTSGSTLNVGAGGTLGTAAFTDSSAYEPALGNPGGDGYILSSTAGGTRSWIAPAANVASSAKLPLANWFKGGLSGKKIAICGDSTSERTTGASVFYERLGSYVVPGGNLEGLSAILDFAGSGHTSGSWISTFQASAIAAGADLYIISLGINDRRQNAASVDTLTANLSSIVAAIHAALPNAEIILRMPNALLSDDPGSTGYVTPLSSAGTYTTELRSVYLGFANTADYLTVFDAQLQLFGITAKPAASAWLMSDILHPNSYGYQAIADALANILTQRTLPFNALRAAEARALNYGADYTVYSKAVEDPDYYIPITSGPLDSQGAGFIDFGSSQADRFLSGDIVRIGNQTPFVFPLGGGVVQLTSTLTRIEMTAPVTGTPGDPVTVYRHRFRGVAAMQPFFTDPAAYPYRFTGYVNFATSGILVIQPDYTSPIGTLERTAISTADTVVCDGQAPVSLSGASFSSFFGLLRIDKAGAFGGWTGAVGVFGNHAYENGTRYPLEAAGLPGRQAN